MGSSAQGFGMTEGGFAMRAGWIVLIVAALVAALIGWAWVDAGKEPLHEISQPVAVPESAR